ncbi:MAG: hypothetical protein ABH878_02680, partial [bacterium]
MKRLSQFTITALFIALLMLGIAARTQQEAISQDKYKTGKPEVSEENPKFKTDQRFAAMLQKEWQKLQPQPPAVQDLTPKPVVAPVASVPASPTPDQKEAQQRSRPISPLESPPAAPVKVDTTSGIAPIAPPPPAKDTIPLRFDFFGAPISLRTDQGLRATLGPSVNSKTIGAHWLTLSQTDYPALLQQTAKYSANLVLNDWGYSLFLYRLSEQIHPQAPNDAALLCWFLLNKAGYDARVGYEKNQVFLLLPSRFTIYETPHYSIGGQKYYLARLVKSPIKAGALRIYQEPYPESRLLDLSLTSAPQLGQAGAAKKLTFQYEGETYMVPITYNQEVVDFLSGYPQTALEVYFAASISEETRISLLNGLKPIIA